MVVAMAVNEVMLRLLHFLSKFDAQLPIANWIAKRIFAKCGCVGWLWWSVLWFGTARAALGRRTKQTFTIFLLFLMQQQHPWLCTIAAKHSNRINFYFLFSAGKQHRKTMNGSVLLSACIAVKERASENPKTMATFASAAVKTQ